MQKLVFTEPETGCQVYCREFKEWHARFEDDEKGTSTPARDWVIYSANGDFLYNLRSPEAYATGRRKAYVKAKEKEFVLNWLHRYISMARRPPEISCLDLDNRGTVCPYLGIASDNTAKCVISPHAGWYSRGSPDTGRDLPKDRMCDLNRYGIMTQLTGAKTPEGFSMRDLWDCKSGRALHWLEKRDIAIVET